ncbi:glycosyltransferase [Streptosporangium sandarakinum]|uniref:glycosyltransferase n=1 Tax=Streptosporangium sandarakinum TaxID=1260955 RepID=UPI0036BC070B
MPGGHTQRIVIGADTYPPDVNGAANFAHRLAVGLAERGHDVHVICPAAQDAVSERVMRGGPTVHRLASYGTPFHPGFRVCVPWRIRGAAARLLDRIAPDVVHVQSHFGVGRTLTAIAGRTGVPVLATNHFMPENLIGYAPLPGRLATAIGRLAWRDCLRVLRRARIVTAPTPRAVRLLCEQGLDGTVLPVSCGLDLRRFAQSPARRADDGPRVLFVGRLDSEKNVDVLLRALPLLPERLPVTAEIVGDGSRRGELEDLARALGIADSVVFHGLVDDQEVLDAYARCDVFCMPGTAELQSLATMEAMAAGKPVVAADAMALPHLVRPGVNGLLFPPGDVPALAAALGSVLGDPVTRTRMGDASRETVARHDIADTLDTFETLYQEAAETPRHFRIARDGGRHEHPAHSGR